MTQRRFTEIEDKLWRYASTWYCGERLTYKEELSPDCMNRTVRRFEWRWYVPEEIRQLWPELSMETRLAMYIFARAACDQDDLIID